MLMKCPACRGTKRVRGVGYIDKTCKHCDGAGVKDIEVIHKPESPKNLIEKTKEVKKITKKAPARKVKSVQKEKVAEVS